MIQFIRKNWELVLVVLALTVLVLFRSISNNHFKSDAKKWAAPSMNQSNTITGEMLVTLKETYRLIDLDKDSIQKAIVLNSERIDPDSLFARKYITSIKEFKGKVILYSSNPGVSARMWMLLSQMGLSNIYILTDSDNEVLKYTLKHDSLPGISSNRKEF